MVLPALALGLGCSTRMSEQGQILAEAHDVSVFGRYMLAGTEICPTFHCTGPTCPGKGEGDFLDCFVLGTEGPVTLGSDGCYRIDNGAILDVAWTFDPVACAAEAYGYHPVSDRISFETVRRARVVPRLVSFEALVETLFVPAPGTSFPTDWTLPPGEPWILVGPFRFAPALFAEVPLVGEVEVGYDLSESGFVAATAVSGVTTVGPTEESRWIEVTVPPGTSTTLWFLANDYVWSDPVARVDGASWEALAASLEIVVAYGYAWNPGRISPVGARAVVRDPKGRLLWGAPVEWSLDQGRLAVGEPLVELPGPDYVLLRDACVPPEENLGEHHAVLRATLGDLTATADLVWTVDAVELTDEPFVPSDACPPEGTEPTLPTGDTGGRDTAVPVDPFPGVPPPDPARLAGGRCGCAGPGATGGGWLVAVALLVRRRRRGSGSRA